MGLGVVQRGGGILWYVMPDSYPRTTGTLKPFFFFPYVLGGRGVCDDCSKARKQVPLRGWDEPVRVCDLCKNMELQLAVNS